MTIYEEITYLQGKIQELERKLRNPTVCPGPNYEFVLTSFGGPNQGSWISKPNVTSNTPEIRY